MTTFITYCILGLLFAVSASFFGATAASEITALNYLGYKHEKRVKWLELWDVFKAPLIPFIISLIFIESSILGLVNIGFLQLGFWRIILGIVELIIIGGIIGYLITFVFANIFFILNSAIGKEAQDSRKSIQESIKMSDRRDALEKRKQGTSGVKVYMCGLCGETSPAGRYVVNSQGMALCEKHAHLASHSSLDISYECPSCGYKFAPKDNLDYFEKHVCSNCGRHLDDTSWGPA